MIRNQQQKIFNEMKTQWERSAEEIQIRDLKIANLSQPVAKSVDAFQVSEFMSRQMQQQHQQNLLSVCFTTLKANCWKSQLQSLKCASAQYRFQSQEQICKLQSELQAVKAAECDRIVFSNKDIAVKSGGGGISSSSMAAADAALSLVQFRRQRSMNILLVRDTVVFHY